MDLVRNIPADQLWMAAMALSAPALLTIITLMVTGREKLAMGIAALLLIVFLGVLLKGRG